MNSSWSIGILIKTRMTTSISSVAVLIIRNMYAQQKIEIWVEKIAFPYFYIFAFCSLTDGQNIYRICA